MEVTLFNNKILRFNTINEFYDYEYFDEIKGCNTKTIEIKEDLCIICKEVKKVIRICDFEDHCYCPYCFCNWYKDHEKKCLLCPKAFEIPS